MVQEQSGWIRHTLDSIVLQEKTADFVSRPKPILDPADHPESRVSVTLEVQHHIHQVFQRAWAGYRAVLGDVADEDHCDTGGFGGCGERRGHGPDLSDTAHHSIGVACTHGLDRVDDNQARAHFVDVAEHRLEVRLSSQVDLLVSTAGALRAHSNLARRLLAGDIQCASPGLRPPMSHLEQQGRLTDARITGQQAHRTRHDATAENPVEFAYAGGKVAGAIRIDRSEGNGGRRRNRAALSDPAADCGNHDLVHRAPRPTLRAATHPFRSYVAAF